MPDLCDGVPWGPGLVGAKLLNVIGGGLISDGAKIKLISTNAEKI